MGTLDTPILGSGNGFVLTARRIKKDKRKTTKKNCFVENQMVLHEEETEITEIEDTSIIDLIADSSQGFSDRSIAR